MPSAKSVWDWYIRLEERRREAVREYEPISGNAETLTKEEVIHHDLILEKDEFDKQWKADPNKQNIREQQFMVAETAIRQLAVTDKRQSGEAGDHVEDETQKKHEKNTSSSVLEVGCTWMVESVKRQKKINDRRIELEEKDFLFE